MSKPLPKQKVLTALEQKLSGSLKFKALKWFFSDRPYRYSSALYSRRHPENKVDSEQRRLMKNLKKKGLSFMEIEETMKLAPASGNEAYRCIVPKRKKTKPVGIGKTQRKMAVA